MCESAFTPSESIRFETTRPEGKAPTLAPRRSGEGNREVRGREPPLGALSPSRRRVSRAGAVGITVRSCLGAGEGFQGSLLLDLAGKPGEMFLAERGRCGRESGTAGRGARRSRTFPSPCFGAGLLLILPRFPNTDVRQYRIRSAISYPASAPMPAAQRVNSFSLKPTPPQRAPTKTKLNKTPTKHNQTKNITDCALGQLSPLPHTGICVHRNLPGKLPHTLSSYFSVQEIK